MRRCIILIALVVICGLPGLMAKDAPTPPDPATQPDKIVIITQWDGPKLPPDTVQIGPYPGDHRDAGMLNRREPEKPKKSIWETLWDLFF